MRKCIFALTLVLLLGVTVSADIVVSNTQDVLFGGDATNEWRTWDADNPYWNRNSMDGTNCNIGYILTATNGACANQNPNPGLPLAGAPGAPIPYLSAQSTNLGIVTGPGNGGAPMGFTFNNTTPADSVTLKIEVAGNANINSFGWFNPTNGALTPLFAGPQTGPITVTLGASSFGFYLTNASNQTYYTDTDRQSADRARQHFALFTQQPTYPDHTVAAGANAESNVYWIGIEDTNFGTLGLSTDGDYNDMIIRVTQVPEPTSVLLFGTLLATAGYGLRRRRS